MVVKPALLLILAIAALSFTSCTTLENRRDMYFPQKVNGPYTRMAADWSGTKKYRTIVKVKSVPAKTGASSDGKGFVAPQR